MAERPRVTLIALVLKTTEVLTSISGSLVVDRVDVVARAPQARDELRVDSLEISRRLGVVFLSRAEPKELPPRMVVLDDLPEHADAEFVHFSHERGQKRQTCRDLARVISRCSPTNALAGPARGGRLRSASCR